MKPVRLIKNKYLKFLNPGASMWTKAEYISLVSVDTLAHCAVNGYMVLYRARNSLAQTLLRAIVMEKFLVNTAIQAQQTRQYSRNGFVNSCCRKPKMVIT